MAKDSETLRGAWFSYQESNPLKKGEEPNKDAKETENEALLPTSVSEPQL
jgi:hypothetical protein